MINFRKKTYMAIILLSILTLTLLFFIKLSEEIWSKGLVVNFDNLISSWVYTFRTPFLTDVMKFITSLASINIIFPLFCLLVILFIIVKRKRYIIPLFLTVLGNSIFVEVVKMIFARARPLISNTLVFESTYSYPSGHSLIAITIVGLIVIYLFIELKSNLLKMISLILGIIVILLVGFSRIYLGAHWPSDVLGSFLIGTTWLCFILLCIENKSNLIKIYKSIVNKINKKSK